MTNHTESRRPDILHGLIAVFCSVFFCRRSFSSEISECIDSGWIWALNRAIRDGRVFGRDFAFTYGPLGFISTRYTGYINEWHLLAADMLMAAGFLYFVYRRVVHARWGIVVMFGAVLMLRNAYAAQVLFLLFFIYVSLIYTAKKQEGLTMIFAGVYSVLLFFVKVSYAVIVPVFLLAGIGLLLARQQWRSLLWLLITVVLLFTVILVAFPVDLSGYWVNGMALIAGYEEAMFLPVDVHSAAYQVMNTCVAIAMGLSMVYAYRLARGGRLRPATIMYLLFVLAVVFLTYKNGITRFDTQHVEQFMAVFPFLFISAAVIAGEAHRIVVMLAGTVMLCMSFACTVSKDCDITDVPKEVWSLISVHGYYSTLLRPSGQSFPPGLLLDKDKRARIGNRTVDIIPHEIYVAPVNGMNYYGRPVCQSYSVYEPRLERLNAEFFHGDHAPEAVLISGNVADAGCYRGFFDPGAHAAILLNYQYEMTTLPGDSIPRGTNDYFLVFGKRAGERQPPQFSAILDTTRKLGDTIDVPESKQPVYVTAEIGYTPLGKVNKLLLQPMPVTITLYMEDGQYYDYKLQLPMLETPVPISRLITSNRELWYFLSGREQEARKIKAFKISTHNREIKADVKIAFYSFDNYRRAVDSTNTQSASPGRPAVLPGSGSRRP